MKKHNFTPVQAEQILNALDYLINQGLNAYSQARAITELSHHGLLRSIEEKSTGVRSIDLSPDDFESMVSTSQLLSDFFFEVGDILDSNNTVNSMLSPDGLELISKQD